MRDPDLVHRAERAAIALERAWSDWRVMHGAGTGPLPQITSYVGYSLTEPWGEPRVVLGVPADEAERLAALLEGHDCFGPVHAEVAGRPDWRRGTSGGTADTADLADAGARSYDRPLDVPAQVRGPESDQFSASWQDLPRDTDSAAWDDAARVRAARDSVTRERVARDSVTRDSVTRDSMTRDSMTRDSMTRDGVTRDGVTRDRAARGRADDRRSDADDRHSDNGLPPSRSVQPDDSASLPEGDHGPGRPQVPWDLPAVPLLPGPQNGQIEPARSGQPAPAPVPAQGGPGYRGPRYLGSPPRYQPEADDDPLGLDDGTRNGETGWDTGVEHHAGTGEGLGDGVDPAGLAQASSLAGAPGEVADFADEDERSWADLGAAVSADGSDVEAELTIETGPRFDAGFRIGSRLDGEAALDGDAALDGEAALDGDAALDGEGDLDAEARLTIEADAASEAGIATEADRGGADDLVADTARADADRADADLADSAGTDSAGGGPGTADTAGNNDRPAARKAARPAGKPVRAAAKRAVRRTRSAAGKADESASATALTGDAPGPGVDPEPDRGDRSAVDGSEQYGPIGAVDAGDAAVADDDSPADGYDGDDGAPASGKAGRPRSRPVARLSRSRRSTPGAHEGSGWPPTSRTAKNSKV